MCLIYRQTLFDNTSHEEHWLGLFSVVLVIKQTLVCAPCNINKPYKIASDTSAGCVQLHTVVSPQQSLIIKKK